MTGPDDRYALALVDLRTGLVRHPSDRGPDRPDADADVDVDELSLWWRYAGWLDRVGATP